MEAFFITFVLPLLAFCSIIFGVWLVYNGIQVWRRVAASQSWQKTQGTILEARLGRHISHDDGNVSVSFFMVKNYEYIVNGKTYTSDQRLASETIHSIPFTPIDEKEKAVKKLLKRRKLMKLENRDKIKELLNRMKGEKIEVFYDPFHHADACLSTKMPSNVFLQFFMAALIFAAGVGLFVTFLVK